MGTIGLFAGAVKLVIDGELLMLWIEGEGDAPANPGIRFEGDPTACG